MDVCMSDKVNKRLLCASLPPCQQHLHTGVIMCLQITLGLAAVMTAGLPATSVKDPHPKQLILQQRLSAPNHSSQGPTRPRTQPNTAQHTNVQ